MHFLLPLSNLHAALIYRGDHQTCYLEKAKKQLIVIDHTQDVFIPFQLEDEPLDLCIVGPKVYILSLHHLFCLDLKTFRFIETQTFTISLKKIAICGGWVIYTCHENTGLYATSLTPQTSSHLNMNVFKNPYHSYINEFVVKDNTVYATELNGQKLLKFDVLTRELLETLSLPHTPKTLKIHSNDLLILTKSQQSIDRVDLETFTLKIPISLPIIPDQLITYEDMIYCIEAPYHAYLNRDIFSYYDPRRLVIINARNGCIILSKRLDMLPTDQYGIAPLIALTPRALYANGTRILDITTPKTENDLHLQLERGCIWNELCDFSIDFSEAMNALPNLDAILEDVVWDEQGNILRMLRHLKHKDPIIATKNFKRALEANCPYARAIAFIAHTYGIFGFVKSDLLASFFLDHADKTTIDSFSTFFATDLYLY